MTIGSAGIAVAPMKALCSERYENWTNRFSPIGLKCMELTGDTEMDDYFDLQDVHVILTTPVCHCHIRYYLHLFQFCFCT